MRKTSFFEQKTLDLHIDQISYRKAIIGNFRSLNKRCHCELIYKLDGASKQSFPDLDLTLELVPNSIYFIPCGSKNSQSIYKSGTIIHIEFDILGDARVEEFLPELIRLEVGNRYKSMFLCAEEIWRKKCAGYYLHAKSIIFEILAEIAADRDKQYIRSSKYALISPALERINRSFRDEIKISELAELCGICDEYLRCLFKSYTGQTPLAYLNSRRLENARELLLSGEFSVAEAAFMSGFENPSYFSRLFKKRYSIAPSRVCQNEAYLPNMYIKF